MSKIKKIIAREIKDSRGNPTVEVELESGKGIFIASVPSGASTGENEALELRDADGNGVSAAIKNVNEIIAPKLKNLNPENQQEIDKIMIELDGTENKSKLGANAILGVSMAVCRAGAGAKKNPLYQHITELVILRRAKLAADSAASLARRRMPLGMFNLIEGGRHVPPQRDPASGGTKNHPEIQEFMVVPEKETFTENLVLCNKIFQNLQDILTKSYGTNVLMGDEGGFAPEISKTEQALFLLKNAIAGGDAKIAIDCAASEFYSNGKYNLDGRELSRSELFDFYADLADRFPIISIEDPFAEEDWNGFEFI